MIGRVWNKLLLLAGAGLGRFRLRAAGAASGGGVVLLGAPIVSCAPGSRIVLGERVTLVSSPRHTALGVNHPVVLRTLRPGAEIRIGDDVGISGGTICAAVRVSIGAETMFGANVTVADTDFHSLEPRGRRYCNDPGRIAARPVDIGRNVFVGTGSIVLKGVRIGDNSVIGAGSVVVSDVPANVVAAGNPCRVLRPLAGHEAALLEPA